jgi:hypothetical protein
VYRFRDTQGRIHRLADEDELRAAIVDGRILRVTPLVAEGESWTAAYRHPAYQKHASEQREPEHGPSLFARLAANPRYRRFASVAGPLLALVLGIWVRRGDFSAKDHAAFAAAVSAAAEGAPIPAEILATPPRRYSDRIVWVVLAASADAEQALSAAEQFWGVSDMPREWMRVYYLRRASRYPHVGRYLDAMQQFHTTYRDSLIVIADRALRTRAAEGKLDEEDLAALLAENRSTAAQAAIYFDLLAQWAREGRRLHQILVSAESSIRGARGEYIVFDNDYWRGQYESTRKRLSAIEARRDTLAYYMQQASMKDFERLARP